LPQQKKNINLFVPILADRLGRGFGRGIIYYCNGVTLPAKEKWGHRFLGE
jgi:hypothetical protein